MRYIRNCNVLYFDHPKGAQGKYQQKQVGPHHSSVPSCVKNDANHGHTKIKSAQLESQFSKSLLEFVLSTGCLKIIVLRFCGYCEGAVDPVALFVTLLHRSGFNLEFKTLFESILHVVADLW